MLFPKPKVSINLRVINRAYCRSGLSIPSVQSSVDKDLKVQVKNKKANYILAFRQACTEAYHDTTWLLL